MVHLEVLINGTSTHNGPFSNMSFFLVATSWVICFFFLWLFCTSLANGKHVLTYKIELLYSGS